MHVWKCCCGVGNKQSDFCVNGNISFLAKNACTSPFTAILVKLRPEKSTKLIVDISSGCDKLWFHSKNCFRNLNESKAYMNPVLTSQKSCSE